MFYSSFCEALCSCFDLGLNFDELAILSLELIALL